MKHIEVKILHHNLDGTPKFLAMLTQRGHQMETMDDVMAPYEKVKNTTPSEAMLRLPHGTIKRMSYITVAIHGLSTKAVSQLRTHATRLTFVSTSTQYSEFSKVNIPYCTPPTDELTDKQKQTMETAFTNIHKEYKKLIDSGVDRDIAGYLLPQALKKVLIISGDLDAWQYVFKVRLCRRNTVEVAHIMQLLYREIAKTAPEYLVGFHPDCVGGKCPEGKFCCGKQLKLADISG